VTTTLRQRIERALADGPGTATDIGLELNADSRLIGVHLRDLWVRGHLQRSLFHPSERGQSIRRSVWMYSLPGIR